MSELQSDKAKDPLENPSSLEHRARALFEAHAADLDGRSRSKLTQARHAALAAAQVPGARWRHWWFPAGGLATTTLVALLFLNLRAPQSPAPDTPVEDMEIIASADNLDLLEDVDFYAWLDTEPAIGVTGEG